uniref:anthranilate synthase component 2 n=1 Tax=Dixoniella grisea TaxID=35153 RepID=UPI001FCDA0D7|nr:anthranilate synthase component 2 [Dixoniella grisea]UNJ17147.1 anthranilate synthase component 2 [Dixoniella grisea]
MILIIDNYDSFTYNLVQLVEELGYCTCVYRNDEISIEKVSNLKPKQIIISPGPGFPNESGKCFEIINHFAPIIPILGICLGHQIIGSLHGAQIIRAQQCVHGKMSQIFHNGNGIFMNIESPFLAIRYHSLIVDKSTIPKNMEITAWTTDNYVMGFKIIGFPNLQGLQFHPESLWTQQGTRLVQNFLLNN